MDTMESPEAKPPLSNRARRWLLTGALAAGLVVGGAAIANAQTSDTTTPDTTQSTPDTTHCPHGQGQAPGGTENPAPPTQSESSSQSI